jgi:peptide/nickel transport system substrate-binding protein
MDAEGRFRPESRYFDTFASEGAAMASGWRQAGFDVQEATFPFVQAQDNQARATFPSMFTFQTQVGEAALIGQTTTGIPRAENRWTGGNRGGFSNSEYDRLVDTFLTTLDRSERIGLLVEMTRIFSEELPAISLFFRTQPWVFVSELSGPKLVASESNMAWNIQEWEFR